MSRSSASSDVRGQHPPEPARARQKPRLTRQCAIQDELEPPGSPGRLTVRFLTTIPSAAETSMQLDDDNQINNAVSPSHILHVTPVSEQNPHSPYFAILHNSTLANCSPSNLIRPQSVLTLHPTPSSEARSHEDDVLTNQNASQKNSSNSINSKNSENFDKNSFRDKPDPDTRPPT